MISKRSIYFILSLLLALPFLGASTRAAQYQGGGQGGPGGSRRGPMSPDDRLKQMTKEFNLTSDEQSKIKPILVDEQKKMEDLRNDSNGDRQAMFSKMMQIRQDTNTQVRSLLDDNQKTQWDQQQQRMQNRRRGPGGPGGQGGPNGDQSAPSQN